MSSVSSRATLQVAIAALALAGLIAGCSASPAPLSSAADPATTSFVVQAQTVAAAAAAVDGVGGRVTHSLGVIHAVGAELTAAQAEELDRSDSVRLFANSTVDTESDSDSDDDSDSNSDSDDSDDPGTRPIREDEYRNDRAFRNTVYPTLVGADQVQKQEVLGRGVAVAIVDTGLATGTVALMLEANPTLTPDEVKCRLVATAKATSGIRATAGAATPSATPSSGATPS